MVHQNQLVTNHNSTIEIIRIDKIVFVSAGGFGRGMATNIPKSDASSAQPVSGEESQGASGGSGSSQNSNRAGQDNSAYECNICLDTARDAVVSMCGHLFWFDLFSF